MSEQERVASDGAAEWHPKPVEYADIDPKKVVVQEGPNSGATEKNLAHDAAAQIMESYGGNAPSGEGSHMLDAAEGKVIYERAAALNPDANIIKQMEVGEIADLARLDETNARYGERDENIANDMIQSLKNTDHSKPAKQE